MKNKLPLLFMLLAIACLEANSQNTQFGISLGANATKGLTSYSGSHFVDNSDFQLGMGFSVGGFAEVPLKHNFLFQPTLSFINKHHSNSNPYATTKTVINTAELNLNYLYRPIKQSSFLIGAGPSFSLGSYSETYTSLDINFNYTNTTSSVNLSYGVNFLAKYEFNHHVAIASNYNLDLQSYGNCKYFGFCIQFGL